MIVLGLHFGHDASIAIIRDGVVLACVERERLTRVKHVGCMRSDDVLACLESCGLTVDDIDYCTLTSTQLVELVMLDRDRLSVTLDRHPRHTLPCAMTDKLGVSPEQMASMASGWIDQMNAPNSPSANYRRMLPEAIDLVGDARNIIGGFEHFIDVPLWKKKMLSADISQQDYSAALSSDDIRLGFHYPGTLNFDGRSIPAYFFSHHVAHAAYSYYVSPFDEAAILTQDGGGGGGNYGCGVFAYGRGNRLSVMTPHHLAVGEIYDAGSVAMNFGMTGAGKLMGLSAYGKPAFFSRDFVGNWYDLGMPSALAWNSHCLQQAEALGYDVEPFGDASRILEPVNVDFAASTQRLAEEILLHSVATLRGALTSSGRRPLGLCLSGGVALNCPANRRILRESDFDRVFVPPAVHDGGLAIGSALALYHNVMDAPRTAKPESPSLAYLGLRENAAPELIDHTLAQYEGKVVSKSLATRGPRLRLRPCWLTTRSCAGSKAKARLDRAPLDIAPSWRMPGTRTIGAGSMSSKAGSRGAPLRRWC